MTTDGKQLVHGDSHLHMLQSFFPTKKLYVTGTTNEARQNNRHRAGVNMEFGLILIPVDRFQHHGSFLTFILLGFISYTCI